MKPGQYTMPELPEVETVARGLRDHVAGRTITGVLVLWKKTVQAPDPAQFALALAGRTIVSAGRRGKYLLLALDNGSNMTIHLRMTGRLFILPTGTAAEPHTRIIWTLSGGHELHFVDPRKFGRVALLDSAALQSLHTRLGPEPLDDLSAEELGQRLARHRVAIKSALLNQSILAGIGNIYADEALYLAGISPKRPANSLSGEEVLRLHTAIRQILATAIDRHGTTLGDEQFKGLEGHMGENQGYLAVFRRTGQPCARCNAPVERIRLGGRSTHFCPQCQR
jgi:formamidopyrimidine-DNA glycosylase